MFKFLKTVIFIGLLAGAFWCGSVLSDKNTLSDDVIRLHVVANSDSQEDQTLKLHVRDQVVALLSDTMQELHSAEEAKAYLQEKLPELEAFVNQVIAKAGFPQKATVSLTREEFDTRQYDTFSLPAGVYEALRITIGEGQGKNWWCVVFPSLCIPATSEDFSDAAVGSGFSDTLTDTLQQDKGYEVRFFFLDCLGRLENLFHWA